MIRGLASSPEGVARLRAGSVVVQLYDALLGRSPSSAEITGWEGQDRGRDALAAAILGSGEYRAG